MSKLPSPSRWLALAALITACSGGTGSDSGVGDAVRGDCDPIAPTHCALPFPSTFFMAEDAESPTGWRLDFGPTTLPPNIDGVQPDPWVWNARDGVSPLSLVMAHFPGVALDGTITHEDLDAYADADAKTVIIDVDTGERVPHFVELDMSHDDDSQRMFMMQPVVPMAHGHRYVVGIRGLVDDTGAAIPASDGFAELRDGTTSADPDVERRRSLYDDVVFPTLEADGIDRSELILAWDFVVASQEGITGRMVQMRDEAVADAAQGVTYTIDSVTEFTTEESEHTARRVYGTLSAPLYTEEDGPNTLLTRDDQGMPYQNGTTQVPFTIIVPRTLVDDPRPGRLVQYGHGLLGGQDEVHAGYLGEMADRYGWILFCVDWTGMKSEDSTEIALMIVEGIERFAVVPERSQQGFVEQLVAAELMVSDSMQSEESLMATPADSDTPVALIDNSELFFYGNSQGSILGGAYAALSPRIERAALGVGGMPYGILLYRSKDFEAFFLIFRTMWPEPLDLALWMGVMQTVWDDGEGSGYSHALRDNPIAGTPDKRFLMQVAVGDEQVTTLGAHIQARAYGASLIDEPVREVWGLETQSSGYEGSAFVEFDYGIDEPVENVPVESDIGDPHEWPRRELAGQDQIENFFESGAVVNFCEGPCVSTGSR